MWVVLVYASCMDWYFFQDLIMWEIKGVAFPYLFIYSACYLSGRLIAILVNRVAFEQVENLFIAYSLMRFFEGRLQYAEVA